MLKTKSKFMQDCISRITIAAKVSLPVVLQGETGTGKSMLARLIHNHSKRTENPFIALDVSVIPETLLESELFGHVKGAFTGADKDKIGYFEAANKGTVLIDELENMNPLIQTKLLQVIEKKQVYPVGSTKPIDIDIRIITATNCNLLNLVKEGKFREDLYYRLAVIIIDIPALRERLEDIPDIANVFLKEICIEIGRDIKPLTEDAIIFLSGYYFSGNIRELRNIMQRAALFSKGDTLTIHDLVSVIEPIVVNEFEYDPPVMPLRDLIGKTECAVIQKAMKKTGNNKTKVSELLGINYKTLFNKLHLYNLIELTVTVLLALTFFTDINDNFRQTRGNCRVKTRTSQRVKKGEK